MMSDLDVDEVMSTDVRWTFEDQPLDDVLIRMADSQICRRTGEGGAGEAASGTESAGVDGTDLPHAGESGIGAVGASGAPPDDSSTRAAGDANRAGRTADPRKTSGVSGQDLQGDGLPPL